jgi:hypothetical protein
MISHLFFYQLVLVALVWLRIPRQNCHRFHGNPATDSTPKLPLIP